MCHAALWRGSGAGIVLALAVFLAGLVLGGCVPTGGGGNDNSSSPANADNLNGDPNSSGSPPDNQNANSANNDNVEPPDNDNGNDNTGGGPTVGGVQIFPSDNPWNTDISQYPVHANSAAYLATIGLDTGLHPDFGTVWEGAPIGIPYNIVDGNQPLVPITFYYDEDSDPGPYPIPPDALIEGGPDSDGDRHILIVETTHKLLYEIFDAHFVGPGWEAGSGAVFDLTSNALRPLGWTSADAAGLPILAGLVRYDDVMEQGEIKHALRFTVRYTQRAYILPATHFASDSTDPNRPPMGLRVRLKAEFDVSGFSAPVQVILRAMQRYGMLVADNGSNWYVSGAPDSRWDDETLSELRQVKGRDFEVIYTGELITN